MQTLNRYVQNKGYKKAVLQYFDGTEILDVVTDGLYYDLRLDHDMDLTPGRLVSITLDDTVYDYEIQTGDTYEDVLCGLNDAVNLRLPQVNGIYTDTLKRLNPNLWSYGGDSTTSDPYHSLYATIENDKLRQCANSNRTWQGYVSRFTLNGDFEVQVDFALIDYPSTNNWRVAIEAVMWPQNKDPHDYATIYREYYGTNNVSTNHNMVRAKSISGTWTVITNSDYSGTTGAFKIRRSGSSFYLSYWNGSSWQGETSLSYTNVPPCRINLLVTSGGSYPNSAAYFSNFKINSCAYVSWPFRRLDSRVLSSGLRLRAVPELTANFSELDTGSWYLSGSGVSKVGDYVRFGSTGTSDYIRLFGQVQGDFDLICCFKIITDTANEYKLHLYASIPSINSYFTVFRVRSNNTPTYRHSAKLNGTWQSESATTVNETTCRLRMRRHGYRFTFYYWSTSVDKWCMVGTAYRYQSAGDNLTGLFIQRYSPNGGSVIDVTSIQLTAEMYIPSKLPIRYSRPSKLLRDVFDQADGSSPNGSIWGDYSEAAIYSSQLTLTCNVSNNGWIKSLENFQGNFIAFLEFSDFSGPATDSFGLSIRASGVYSGHWIQAQRLYESGDYYRGQYSDDSTFWTDLTKSSTSDTAGFLRVSRDGALVSVHYFNGAVWASLGSSEYLDTEDVRIDVRMDGWDSRPSASVTVRAVCITADQMSVHVNKYSLSITGSDILGTKRLPLLGYTVPT